MNRGKRRTIGGYIEREKKQRRSKKIEIGIKRARSGKEGVKQAKIRNNRTKERGERHVWKFISF